MPGPAFIDGDDVTLRTIEKEDLQYLKQVRNSPTVWRAIGRPWPVNAEQEQEFLRKS
jgi:hypothetical protein